MELFAIESKLGGTSTAFKWQSDALETMQRLGESESYKPRYFRVFKRAQGMGYGLSELVEDSLRNAKHSPPGAYFLIAAERALGLARKK